MSDVMHDAEWEGLCAGRNASPNISAHSYGASFDIYKLDNTDSCSETRKAFEAVPKEFQKNGSILLCLRATASM
jgi:hypothetical protein